MAAEQGCKWKAGTWQERTLAGRQSRIFRGNNAAPEAMSTGGEVANALVCKTSIRGFNSLPVLHAIQEGPAQLQIPPRSGFAPKKNQSRVGSLYRGE